MRDAKLPRRGTVEFMRNSLRFLNTGVSRMRRNMALISVVLIALLAANFGLNLWAAELAKETGVSASGALVEKGTDRHLSTLQKRVSLVPRMAAQRFRAHCTSRDFTAGDVSAPFRK